MPCCLSSRAATRSRAISCELKIAFLTLWPPRPSCVGIRGVRTPKSSSASARAAARNIFARLAA